ncbi:MAG: D-alanyl-D-alanine carboxypeptidase family protein [Ruminococcaceae bacterium]|nr:D-alanyl-D-alanine carboxypeptidase family protein [Oscillospiraceae bacterium]
MDRKQADRLREEKRKLRRRKKIKGYTLMVLCAVIIIALIVFAVKGVIGLVTGDEIGSDTAGSETVNSESIGDTSSDSENISSGGEVSSEENSEEPVSGEDSSSTEPENSNASTTPAGEKPEASWSTMLVNQWSYMPEGYVPEVRPVVYEGVSPLNNQFDVRAAEALEQMLADARAAGYNMYLVSAYRSHDYQVNLFNRKVNEYKALGYDDTEAYNQASQWVAIPGTSEHCTGLAADIVSSTWYNHNSDLTHDFEETEHFDWLYSHCADYGFILRYPKNREATTGITYEPWHYRYVGVEAAKYIMENNITLEEFCAE